MMYRERGAHTLHDQPLSVYFDKLLHGEYYSVLIYEQNNNQQYKYENFSDNQWIHESFKDDLFRIDRMHELWMKMAGIELK